MSKLKYKYGTRVIPGVCNFEEARDTVIEIYRVNNKGTEESVCNLGSCIGRLEQPSPVEIEDLLERTFPGCEVIKVKVNQGIRGTTYKITEMRLPGVSHRVEIETEEEPINGDYENGWLTYIYVGSR